MKKSLISLLVLACVAPAMAVTVTLSEPTNGTLHVEYALEAGETNIRGLALVFDVVSGDAALDSVDAGAFNTFIDYAIDAVGYELGQGHPVADPDAAGAIDPATAPTKFAVSMGYLDEAGAQAGLGNGSFDVVYDGTVDSNVTVSVDTLRGGIVGDDVAGVTITNPTITLHFAPVFPSCQDYNLTKKKGGLTDNSVNVADITNIINYINTYKISSTVFLVPVTSPNYDADYNFDGASSAINVADVTNMINWIDTNKISPTVFLVICQ